MGAPQGYLGEKSFFISSFFSHLGHITCLWPLRSLLKYLLMKYKIWLNPHRRENWACRKPQELKYTSLQMMSEMSQFSTLISVRQLSGKVFVPIFCNNYFKGFKCMKIHSSTRKVTVKLKVVKYKKKVNKSNFIQLINR